MKTQVWLTCCLSLFFLLLEKKRSSWWNRPVVVNDQPLSSSCWERERLTDNGEEDDDSGDRFTRKRDKEEKKKCLMNQTQNWSSVTWKEKNQQTRVLEKKSSFLLIWLKTRDWRRESGSPSSDSGLFPLVCSAAYEPLTQLKSGSEKLFCADTNISLFLFVE